MFLLSACKEQPHDLFQYHSMPDINFAYTKAPFWSFKLGTPLAITEMGKVYDVATEAGRVDLAKRMELHIPAGYYMTFETGREFLLERDGVVHARISQTPYYSTSPSEPGGFSMAITLLNETCDQFMVDKATGKTIREPIRANANGKFTLTTGLMNSYGYSVPEEVGELNLPVWKQVDRSRQHYFVRLPDAGQMVTIDFFTVDNTCQK